MDFAQKSLFFEVFREFVRKFQNIKISEGLKWARIVYLCGLKGRKLVSGFLLVFCP